MVTPGRFSFSLLILPASIRYSSLWREVEFAGIWQYGVTLVDDGATTAALPVAMRCNVTTAGCLMPLHCFRWLSAMRYTGEGGMDFRTRVCGEFSTKALP